MERFFDTYQRQLFWGLLLLSTLCGFLLFDLRMSHGGDDSVYITRAWNLIQKGQYPGFQGPLYPMVLALIVGMGGIKIGLLKTCSMLFLAGHFFFFYRTFRKSVEPAVLWPVLMVVALNSFVHYYGSQTYSEAFFMLLQMAFFWYFTDRFIAKKNPLQPGIATRKKENNRQKRIFKYLGLGALLLALGLTRSIGFAALFAVIAYFLLFRQWRNAGRTLLAFLLLYGGFKLITGMVLETPVVQFGSQASLFTWTDPYDQSQGKESFTGFFMRFADNSNLYLSKHLPRISGFRNAEATTIRPVITLLLYLLFAASFLFAFRKNKALVFTGLYLIMTCGITFFLLQSYWDSDRLIIPFFPLIVLFLLYGLKELLAILPVKQNKVAVWGAGALLVVLSATGMLLKAKANAPVLRASLKGDATFGLEAWRKNYLDACSYAAQNLPRKAIVAVRKPSMAFLHTGKEYMGLYKVPAVSVREMFSPGKAYLIVKSREVHPRFHEYYLRELKGIMFGYGARTKKFPANVSYQIYAFEPDEMETVKQNIATVAFPYMTGPEEFLNSFVRISCMDPVQVAAVVKEKKMDYMILDQLRLDGKAISVLTYKFIVALNAKYPEAVESLYIAGDVQLENATVFRFHRDKIP